jgi:hypothetical protein
MNKTSFLMDVGGEWQNEKKRYCTMVEKKARSQATQSKNFG